MFLNPISCLAGFNAGWIPRLDGVDVSGDRDFALRNLAPHHDRIAAMEFPGTRTRHHAEQVHGNRIAVISKTTEAKTITHPHVDGLITKLPNELLAIYVADCAAIYLADPVTSAIALLHSGKKGTEQNILAEAVGKMTALYGTNPVDLVCVVSPCVRPPDYEVDFATTIASQAASLGIVNFHDSCENTAADLKSHYSYRVEQGRTGRMLALLLID